MGSWLFTKSGLCQMRVSPDGARLEPLISTHEFGEMVATPPSAFATSVITGAGVVRGSGARATGEPPGPKIEEWGSQFRQGVSDQTFDSGQLIGGQLLFPACDWIEVSPPGRERGVGASHGTDGGPLDAVVVEIMLEEAAQPPKYGARITNQLFEPNFRIVLPEQRASRPAFLNNPFPVKRGTFGGLAIFPRKRADITLLRERDLRLCRRE